MTAIEVHQPGQVAPLDREAILRHLKLDPNSVDTQALILICERYGLDPLLKHVVLIQGRPYITRDGYLATAHRSGVFDGIEVVEESDTGSHWTAKVSVWRKDMGRPFTYSGRYPKSGHQKTYGPEMAVKTAEVMALRRAFNVTGVGAADERWDEGSEVLPAETMADRHSSDDEPVEVVEYATKDQIDSIKGLTKRLTAKDRANLVPTGTGMVCGVDLIRGGKIVATYQEAEAVIDTLTGLVNGHQGATPEVTVREVPFGDDDPGRPFTEDDK